MNIQRDTEYRFGELVQSPEYSNEQGVVVMIKSLATGQTMKVYLDKPTQEVVSGINVTRYTGHFDEEEFMVTLSEGIEITGLPLMYPYYGDEPFDDNTIIIDTQNHSIILKSSNFTDPVNIAERPTNYSMQDFPFSETLPDSGNAVVYRFIRSNYEEPTIGPADPGPIPIEPINDGNSDFVPQT